MRIIKFAAVLSVAAIAMSAFAGLGINVAATDDTETLQSKIDATGTKAATITLDKDYTENITIAKGQDITLDLGTYTLKNSGDAGTITNNGTLTVVGSGTISNSNENQAVLRNYGTATVSGGTLTGANYGICVSSGKVTISGGTVSGGFACVCTVGGTLDVKGGTIGSNDGKDELGVYAYKGSATISGGVVIAQCGLYAINGNITVTGGTFHGDVSIGCYFDSDNVIHEGTGTITINGGTFDGLYVDDVREYLDGGYTFVATETDEYGESVFKAVSTNDESSPISYIFDKPLSEFATGSLTLGVTYTATVTGTNSSKETYTYTETKTGTTELPVDTTITGDGTAGVAVIFTNIPDNVVIESVTLR